jgi:hypothetical protein
VLAAGWWAKRNATEVPSWELGSSGYLPRWVSVVHSGNTGQDLDFEVRRAAAAKTRLPTRSLFPITASAQDPPALSSVATSPQPGSTPALGTTP